MESWRLSRDSRKGRRLAGFLLSALVLSLMACITPMPENGNYAEPIGSSAVTLNTTVFSEPLRCLRGGIQQNAALRPTVTVGRLLDYTGKYSQAMGNDITQGATLMAISALGKAGVPQVERFDTSIAEAELKFANNKLIGDSSTSPYRKIYSGSIRGSDYYIAGGVTELNYNIRSISLEGILSGYLLGVRFYVLNIGLDLRLVKTQTLEVVNVMSLQKQVIGREYRGGFIDFIGGGMIDGNAGHRAQEPIQLAVRTLIERSVFDMLTELYSIPTDKCFPEQEAPTRPRGWAEDASAAVQ